MNFYGCRINDEMANSLKKYAKKEGQPLSVIIRFAISDFLKRNMQSKVGG